MSLKTDTQRGYYDRESHDTSLNCVILGGHGCLGALVLGGLLSLAGHDILTWGGAIVGGLSGLITGSLCLVAGRCSREEEERDGARL